MKTITKRKRLQKKIEDAKLKVYFEFTTLFPYRTISSFPFHFFIESLIKSSRAISRFSLNTKQSQPSFNLMILQPSLLFATTNRHDTPRIN
jgi:hypothetical protein